MGCSCRTFREEPLARPCVSQEEPPAASRGHDHEATRAVRLGMAYGHWAGPACFRHAVAPADQGNADLSRVRAMLRIEILSGINQHKRPLWAEFIFVLDSWLQWWGGVFEYSRKPDCI